METGQTRRKAIAFRTGLAGLLLLALPATSRSQTTAPRHHNVIIFVADGLRHGSVNPTDTPALWRIRTEGVHFRNSHSVFPTFTTANASAIATGHGLGDTGDFSNTIYIGYPQTLTGLVTPFLEDDAVLRDLDGHFSGNYLGERTLLGLARERGYAVASVGKLGPTAIQQGDSLTATPPTTPGAPTDPLIVLDDQTGHPRGFPVPPAIASAISAAGLPAAAPDRSNGSGPDSPENNGNTGGATRAGTRQANLQQQQWFVDVTTRVVLPHLQASGRPFAMLFWSRDPDGTQHNEGDSLQTVTPGINGPTVTLALRNADHCLQQLLDWLDAHPDLKATTDIFITSDHGFATISRREIDAAGDRTKAASALGNYAPIGRETSQPPPGTLPNGFLAIDLALALHTDLFDPELPLKTPEDGSVFRRLLLDAPRAEHPLRSHPQIGSGLLGHRVTRPDASDAQAIVAANGGSDLIYVPDGSAATVRRLVGALARLDYVGGLFVDDRFGHLPGTLPLSTISLVGSSRLPRPAIVVAFRVFYLRSGDLQSAVQVSDTSLQEGQGMHGGFGRESTFNNMAAIGPDFRQGFADDAPAGNIDIAPTLAAILGLHVPAVGNLRGRVLSEALATGTAPNPRSRRVHVVSAPGAGGRRTVLDYQQLGPTRYFDRGCYVRGKGQSTRCDEPASPHSSPGL